MSIGARVSPDLPLLFVLPRGSEHPSGGNLYNRALHAALAELAPIRCLAPAEWRSLVESGAAGLYFFDSLDLDAARKLERAAGQHFGLVVHHLPSLEPDVSDRARVLAREAEALAAFELFLCTSAFTSEYLASRGVEPERLLTVAPAPPALRASARHYEPPLSALVVANLIPRKDILSLLETLARRREAAEFELVVVGRDDIDPAYADACRACVRDSAYLAARVRLDAAVPHERIFEYYETADLLLSPAKMETFGMAIQEARAHGLPVVVRQGGFSEQHVAERENGLVVADVEALAEALLQLARDPLRMAELFAGAQQTRPSAGYGWREAAESLLAKLGRRATET